MNVETIRARIGGDWAAVEAIDDVKDPYRGELVARAPCSSQRDLDTALDFASAAKEIIVNGSSRWRSDQMPDGGVKDSGIGREGPKCSTLDMTEERFFVFN